MNLKQLKLILQLNQEVFDIFFAKFAWLWYVKLFEVEIIEEAIVSWDLTFDRFNKCLYFAIYWFIFTAFHFHRWFSIWGCHILKPLQNYSKNKGFFYIIIQVLIQIIDADLVLVDNAVIIAVYGTVLCEFVVEW